MESRKSSSNPSPVSPEVHSIGALLPALHYEFKFNRPFYSLMDLEALKKKVIAFRDERDWKQYHNPKDLALSINVEAGELAQLFQWKTDAEIKEALKDSAKLQELKHELADIMIYCLDMAEETGVDLEKAILDKLEHNSKKYPIEKAKGSAKKYTEL